MKRKSLFKHELERIDRRVLHEVMTKTAMKYKILRVRAKLSYEAFIKKQTLAEMFISKILDTWNLFKEYGLLNPEKISSTTSTAVQRLVMGDMNKTF